MVGMILCSQMPHKSEGGSFRKQLSYVRDLPVPVGLWRSRYNETVSYPTERMLEILDQVRVATEVALSYSAEPKTGIREFQIPSVGDDSPAKENFPSPVVAENVVERAKRHLGRHLHERVPLKRLAMDIGCSPVTLTRKFRRETGTSIPAYLNSLKVREAETMLSTTLLSISEICGSLGFADERHFRRVFRLASGLSPREFRQAKWIKGRESAGKSSG
jgi:AraC-like DNA-binding protein